MSKTVPTEFIIDDGVKEYTFKNTMGDIVAVFRFNPSDTNLIHNFQKVIDFLDSYEYEEGKTPDEVAQAITDMDNAIIGQVESLFGKVFTDGMFSTYKPCSMLENGDFYVEKAFAIVGRIIEDETGNRIEKKKARVRRDLAKRK